MVVDERYNLASKTYNDIWEHLPTLKRYAQQCKHVTEMGVRNVVSTWALMAARPTRMVSYDLYRDANVAIAEAAATECGVDFEFRLEDTRVADIEPTDLLFIDTAHYYEHLLAELTRHGKKVQKYILLHDTKTFGMIGEKLETVGLIPAVNTFMESHREWQVKEIFLNNNGMHVLEKSPTQIT